MKVALISDVHLEFGNCFFENKEKQVEWLNILFWLKDFMASHNNKEQNLIDFKKIEKI